MSTHEIEIHGLLIVFDYRAPIKETPRTASSGGDPPWPAEVDIINAQLHDQEAWDDACLGELPCDLERWCQDRDDIYNDCCTTAEEH